MSQVAVRDLQEKGPVDAGPFSFHGSAPYYGLTLLMRVAQLPRDTRVPPQLVLARYWVNVHVCAMYSLAIQIDLPSTAVAP